MKTKTATDQIKKLKKALASEKAWSAEKDEIIVKLETDCAQLRINEQLRLTEINPKCFQETAKEKDLKRRLEVLNNSMALLAETVKMQNRLINKVVPPNTANH